MATSGSVKQYQYLISGGSIGSSSTANSGFTMKDISLTTFSWELVSQDPVTNQSTVNWTLSVSRLNYSPSSFTLGRIYIWDKATSRELYKNFDYVDVLNGGSKSGTFVFTHDANGMFSSKTIEIQGSMRAEFSSGSSYRSDYAIEDLTATITLPTIIPYGVLDSVPNFNDEENPTINYTIPTGVTNVEAFISFSGQTETIKARPIDVTKTSYTFNFTEDERTTLRSILSQGLSTKQVTFHLRSTTGSQVYYSSKTATLSIINYMPIFDPVVEDDNDVTKLLTNDPSVLVSGLSNAKYDIRAEGRKGASIVSWKAKNGDVTKDTATGIFEKVLSPNFTFTATDSFGRRVSGPYNLPASNWIPYVKITCSAEFTDMTADGDLKITLKGKFYEGKFGAKGKTNRMRVNYDITEGESEEFTHVDLGYADLASNYGNSFTVSGNDYTYVINIKNELDYTKSYSFRIRVSDEVSVTPAEVASVVSPTPIFDWSRTDFNFNVPVTIQGGSVPTIQAQGTSGIWTYRTWSDGTAECWGKKDVSVTFPSSANWGGLYTTGAISASNISFPFGLFAETPVVNASLLIRSAGGILMAPGGAGSNIANMDQTGVYEIARGASVSGTQYYTINYQVIGKWK
jgi:hypothetical protein